MKKLFSKQQIVLSAILLSTTVFFSCQERKEGYKAYYISSKSNEKSDGSLQNPWKSLSQLDIQSLQAGDTICFMGGETFNEGVLIDSLIAGTEAKPVVITSYGNIPAIINSGNNIGFRISNSNHLKIENLQMVGSGRKEGNTTDGMLITDCSNISVQKINVKGYQKSGFHIHASTDILADSIFAYDNGFCGIYVSGHTNKTNSRNIIVKNSRAENNAGDPTALDNHSGNGILINYSTNVTIEYCTATNNGWDMPRIGNGPVGIWVHDADSILIQHCIAYKNKTSKGGEDGGGFDLDGGVTNTIIQYCLSYENEGGGIGLFQYAGAGPWYNNTIRYCVSENDGTTSTAHAGIYIWNAMDDTTQLRDCKIHNNVIYNENGAAIRYAEQSKNSGFHFSDNIFVAKDTLITGIETGGTFIGNNWYSLSGTGFNIAGITNLEAWAKKSGNEWQDGKVTGLNLNPQFKNPGKTTITNPAQLSSSDAYQLPEDSPLKKMLEK